MVAPNTVEFNRPDSHAATFVVAPQPTTPADFYGAQGIQDALDALPDEGGTIFLHAGTYQPETVITLPDKPVRIVGAGQEATVLDLGANLVFLFRVEHDHPYSFEEFKVVGNDDAGQGFLSIGDSVTGIAEILCRRISVGDLTASKPGVETFVSVDSRGFAWVSCWSCRFCMGAANALYCDGDADLSMHDCYDEGGVGGFSKDSDLFLWLFDSILSLSSNCSVTTLEASNCIFYCEDGASLDTWTVSSRLRVYGCSFETSGSGPRRYLDIAAASGQDSVVVGCYFGACQSEAIRTARSYGFFAGNVNCKVTETGSANHNRYVQNTGFTGSTLTGASSKVDHRNVRSVSSNTTLDDSYDTVLVDASGGAVTITLPAAANCKFRTYTIKKTDSSENAVTVDGNGAETIDGDATYGLSSRYQSVTIICDGTSWWVI